MERLNRRDVMKMGAAAGVGAAVAAVWTRAPSAASASEERHGGVHVSVLTHIVSEAGKGFPHHFVLTVYGPDNALTGMGWGGAFDLKMNEEILNSKMFPCIYSLTGAIQGDLLKVHGLMLYAGDPTQGMPLDFEANLMTGHLRVNAYNAILLEGTGTVFRI